MRYELVTGAMLFTVLLGLASARPARDNEIVYFKNKSLSEVVGTFYMACNSAVTRTGTVTKHYVRYQGPCDGGGSIGPNCYVDGASARCTPEILRFLRRN